jgi:hypothetical protein
MGCLGCRCLGSWGGVEQPTICFIADPWAEGREIGKRRATGMSWGAYRFRTIQFCWCSSFFEEHRVLLHFRETMGDLKGYNSTWQIHANRVSPRFTKYTHLAVAHNFILRTFPVPVRARCIASAQLEPTTLSNKHEHQPFPSANSHSILGSHIDAPDYIQVLQTPSSDERLHTEFASRVYTQNDPVSNVRVQTRITQTPSHHQDTVPNGLSGCFRILKQFKALGFSHSWLSPCALFCSCFGDGLLSCIRSVQHGKEN